MTLKPSVYLSAAFTAVHVGAAVTLVPVALPWWVKLCLLAFIALSLASALWRHAWLRSRHAIKAIDIAEQDATVYRNDGRCEQARILATTYASSVLAVVNLRVGDRILPRHMILVPDNVDPQAFRRLRVWLRWGYRPEL